MAFTTLSKLTKRMWENKHLKIPTKVNVYNAFVITTLLGSLSTETENENENGNGDVKPASGLGRERDVL